MARNLALKTVATPNCLTPSKARPLANREARRIEADHKLFAELVAEGDKDGGHGAVALPFLDEVVDDLPALNVLSEAILREG